MPKILITGASGFLGSTMVPHLLSLHHSLTTIGITDTDNIHCNLASSIPNIDTNVDWVIHAAGKAHVVPRNSNEIAEFYQVNLEGTKNLLKGLEQTDKLPKAIVFISTVAVYGVESGTNITEEYPILGNSPYALSKIQA